MAEIHITQALVKKMYNELSEEIKKDEYNNTYAWFTWTPTILNDNIEEALSFSQEDDVITAWYETSWDEKAYNLDFLKENLKGVVDFEKWEKEAVDENGTIWQLDLKYLLENKIILDREKFLKAYFKDNEVCLLKDIELKKLNITQLVFLYLDLLFNEYSGIVEIIPLESMEQNDIVGKHL